MAMDEVDVSQEALFHSPFPGPSKDNTPNAEDKRESTPTSSEQTPDNSNGDESSGDGRLVPRILRKRKLNLNSLSAGVTCPLVCQFQHCGIQLKDGDSLRWHYEAHYGQEVEKLKKVRVKKSFLPVKRKVYEKLRYDAFERIRFRREMRTALPTASREPTEGNPGVTRCPVCDQDIPGGPDDLTEHVGVCLQTEPQENEEEVDIEGFEEYEWAGQRRIRAASMVDMAGGSGVLTITPGDEDEELDVEGNIPEEDFGPTQYTEASVILPESETGHQVGGEDGQGEEETVNVEDDHSEDPKPREAVISSKVLSDLRQRIEALNSENHLLRNQTCICKVCMDPYQKPLVSTACWHVHCEQCWLRALGAKKLCPQCKVIIQPEDLRKIYI